MISRVAESCFWLSRYIERADTVARLASLNRYTVLDSGIVDADRWQPVMTVIGERERFETRFGAKAYNSDTTSEEYLTWNEDNPVSITTSLYRTRENARMTREVISREMWESVNTLWQWLNGPAARKEYRKDRIQFYRRIRSMCAEFNGISHDSMLHEEPFDFMRLGMLVERGSQTARVLDIRRHWRGPMRSAGAETPEESAQWVAVLRLCAAIEPFFKHTRSAPTGPLVAQFLLQHPTFPRSVRHCLDRTQNFLQRVEKDARRKGGAPSSRLARSLALRLRMAKVDEMTPTALHDELSQIISAATALCDQISVDYFDPVRSG
jgi:uncharacterized alpha-E superfamily protein